MESTRTAAPATTYTIDPSHTTVEFVARHMMFTKVRGRFAKFAGTLQIPEGSNTPSAIDVTIEAASLDTREEQRDTHLRSADFFDVEKFPQLAFKSTKIAGDESSFKVTGDLTIRGITKEVTLDAQFEGRGTDPWGGTRVGYSAQTTINRKDWGLNWNAALEAGGVLVGDSIGIELNVQAVAQA